jgi:hypothetical protein
MTVAPKGDLALNFCVECQKDIYIKAPEQAHTGLGYIPLHIHEQVRCGTCAKKAVKKAERRRAKDTGQGARVRRLRLEMMDEAASALAETEAFRAHLAKDCSVGKALLNASREVPGLMSVRWKDAHQSEREQAQGRLMSRS